jgi:proteasome assembly chaperone 2
LATDLLISTFSFQKIESIESPYVIPVIGNDTFSPEKNEGKVSLSLEVFGSKISNLMILQQRAPVITVNHGDG